jgi:hypothetical protein
MAVTSVFSGTQSASVSVEHTLASTTTAGVYVFVVDLASMASADVVVLRVKTKCISGGTSRVAYIATYAYTQGDPIKYSIPVPVDTEIVCTLEQTAGVARAGYPWNLLKM